MSEKNIILDYAKQNYKMMLREKSGILKHPFIVPGSQAYVNELWDWDSWLTNIALRQIAEEDISRYEKGCIYNFLDWVDEEGRVPVLIQPGDDAPVGFAENSDKESNIHKPCLAQHIAFIIKQDNDAEWIRDYYHLIERFVDFYINNCRHKTGLYFWIDDCAIGVDNDPCTLSRPKRSSGSIYLNCLMYKELEAICYIGERLGKDTKRYNAESESLKESIREHCYDEKDGFYYSVDLNLIPINKEEHPTEPPRHWDCLIQRIGVWSGFLAMWCGIATPEQAERMVKENLLDPKAFWSDYGVRSLSQYEKMYVIKASGNPSCWLGPIWGVVNYMVFKGLVRYGYDKEARMLAENTVNLLETDIKKCGEMHEYYDPETGLPIINPGFQNWNLLAVNMKAWLNGEQVITEF